MEQKLHISEKRIETARALSRESGRAGFAHQYVRLLNYALIVFVAQLVILLFAASHWHGFGSLSGFLLCGVFSLAFLLAIVLIALAFAPLVRLTCRRLQNLTIRKYADLERPLLRRLSLEAPGTYHHVMMVGDLAQAACDAIGANGLLARAGAYYHDIGKLSNPRFFMENQTGIGNPHDKLPPNISRMIITNHVKEGLALAKLNRIPRVISRFIETHHGTSVVNWFMLKECSRRGDLPDAERIDVANYFRYTGPLPRTREEAIVSLADSVEAASRSMKFFDEAKIKRLVTDIVRDRLLDGQFAESVLTIEELAAVTDAFTLTLVHLLHGRLPYPSQK